MHLKLPSYHGLLPLSICTQSYIQHCGNDAVNVVALQEHRCTDVLATGSVNYTTGITGTLPVNLRQTIRYDTYRNMLNMACDQESQNGKSAVCVSDWSILTLVSMQLHRILLAYGVQLRLFSLTVLVFLASLSLSAQGRASNTNGIKLLFAIAKMSYVTFFIRHLVLGHCAGDKAHFSFALTSFCESSAIR